MSASNCIDFLSRECSELPLPALAVFRFRRETNKADLGSRNPNGSFVRIAVILAEQN